MTQNLTFLRDSQYKPHPILTRALDKMFILNIESGFTPCAVVVRGTASARYIADHNDPPAPVP